MVFIKFYNKYSKYLNLSELFNIYLVLSGGRLAYLSEIVNTNELIIIKRLFPNLKYIDDGNGRTFIYRNKLPLGDLNDDIWIAKVLGFDCLGIPNMKNITYNVDYTINDNSFLTFICDNPSKIKNKISYFQQYAGSEFKIDRIIEKIIPDDWIPKAILEKNIEFLNNHKIEFCRFLYNHNAYIICESTTNINKIFNKCYDWLVWFALCELELNPIEIFIPLSIKEGKLYQQELNKLICKHKPQCIKWYKFIDTSPDDPRIYEYKLDCKYINDKYKLFKDTYI